MNPRILVEATEEPISLGVAYSHLKIDYDSDNPVEDEDLISLMLTSAREYAEQFTGLTLSQKTYELSINEEVKEIYLPFPPVSSIDSVTYETYENELDSNGEQVLDSDGLPVINTTVNHTTYTFNQNDSIIKFTGITPKVTNNFKVTYIAGDVSLVPSAIKIAILILLGHFYEHREDSTEKALTSIPNGAENILRPYRERLGMA